MKIALCLHGQPRFFDAGHKYLNNIFLSKYNVDVFAHFWYDENSEEKDYISAPWLDGGRAGKPVKDLPKKLVDLYKPITYFYEPQIQFNIPRDYSSFGSMSPPQTLFSYFYSVKHSSLLREGYERVHNFVYDWVVFARYDYAITTNIDFKQLNNNNFYFPDDVTPNEHNKEVINNGFVFSSSKNMTDYSRVFDNIDRYWVNDQVRMGAECLSGWHMKVACVGAKSPIKIQYAYIRQHGAGYNEINYKDAL